MRKKWKIRRLSKNRRNAILRSFSRKTNLNNTFIASPTLILHNGRVLWNCKLPQGSKERAVGLSPDIIPKLQFIYTLAEQGEYNRASEMLGNLGECLLGDLIHSPIGTASPIDSLQTADSSKYLYALYCTHLVSFFLQGAALGYRTNNLDLYNLCYYAVTALNGKESPVIQSYFNEHLGPPPSGTWEEL